MQMTQCPSCKRIVAAVRKTRGFTRDGHLLTVTEIRPLRHLEDNTGRRPEICAVGEFQTEEAAA